MFDVVHPDVSAANGVRVRPVYFAKTPVLRAAYVVELVLSRSGTNDVRAFQRAIPPEHWRAVFYDNAARVFGFDPARATPVRAADSQP